MNHFDEILNILAKSEIFYKLLMGVLDNWRTL